MIEVKNITYSYPNSDSKALNDLSVTIQDQQWIALVGHNGSGKSTIARVIDGLVEGYQGEVTVNGMPLNDDTVWDIRDQIGFVFQNPDNQFVGATVQDDVAFGLENRNVPRPEMVERVQQALEVVGMSEFATREPSSLSGGQKQRVALAGAIALQPKILILDEATSMLDPQGRQEMLEILKQMKQRFELTIIMITHDLAETAMADRVLLMNHGQLVADAQPEKLFARTQVIKDNGLELPYSEQLKEQLAVAGIDLPREYMNEDRMVEWLWDKLN